MKNSAFRFGCVAAAVIAAFAGAAGAQSSITLFGRTYNVQRLDYSQQIQLPNIAFPQDGPMAFFESEGVIWAGSNKLVMTADDIFDLYPGNPDNWAVEVNVNTNAQGQVSLSLSRVIFAYDRNASGFDINPTGVTINPGALGLGAGGNLVVCNGRGNLLPYSYQTETLGQLLSNQASTPCTTGPGLCRLSMAGNVNAEDVTFVPSGPEGGAQFYSINQDTDSVERWSVAVSGSFTGQQLGTFPVGRGIATGPALSAAKGLTYVPDASTVPPSIRRAGGSILVAFDDNYPALQAFDLSGNLLATEFLTTDGQPTGPSRLDLTGCIDPLQLESLTIDPATGRIFLVNQGALTECNFMYVLTPQVCAADADGNGQIEVADIFAFLSRWFSGDARADIDGNSQIEVADIFAFLSRWFAGC